MKKRILLIFIILCGLSFQSTFASTSNSMLKPFPTMDGQVINATILLDGAPVTFEQTPIVLNNGVFVSCEELFKFLGVQMYWFEDTNELVGYRDNTFIKFNLNSDVAYINGSKIKLSAMVSTRSGRPFVPIETIANAFEFTYDFDSISKTISLDFRENIYQYKQIGFRQYKKITTTNWGISFFVPEYWEPIEDNYSAYGIDNDFESYSIVPSVLPLDNNFNRNILTDTFVKNMKYQYGGAIDFTDPSLTVHNGFLSNEYKYTLTLGERLYNGILYVFFENNIGYVFDCRFDAVNSLYEGNDIFDAVMDTFQISKITIDTNAEHYIELNKFFEYHTKLTSPIYSNIMGDGQIAFTGTVEQNDTLPLKGYHIVISKDDERIEYYAPILSNAFDARIPLPFGVGKHNISVYADEPSGSDEMSVATDLNVDEYIEEVISETQTYDPKALIIRFSVLNTTDEDTKYLLPSTYIDFDHTEVYTTSNSITFDQSSDYGKAKTIYQWLYKHYEYKETVEGDEISTARKMLARKDGSDLELSFVYAGLLRSLDIQARVVRGDDGDNVHYWVEVFLNGKWILTDVAADIQDRDVLKTIYYFDISTTRYSTLYEKTELLPF